jgi:dihydroorotate dehydrogenase electron transfer subunit
MSCAATAEARVTSNSEIAKGVYRLELGFGAGGLGGPRPPRPGQFVTLRLLERDMLLPRPFSICDVSERGIALVYGVVGAGTKAMSGYAPGAALRVSGPSGNGFDTDAAEGYGRVTLVGGGLGAPPLLLLAKELRRKTGAALKAVLGFRSEAFLVDEFAACCDAVLLATEDGSQGYRGTALGLLKNEAGTGGAGGDYYFACGPAPMLRALARFAGGQGIPLQLSLEERMGCGYGACLGCVCKTAASRGAEGGSVANRRVCVDGPVFFGDEVAWYA